MKLLILLNVVLFSMTLFGQVKTKITYYNKNGIECDSIDGQTIVYRFFTDTVTGIWTEKTMNIQGQIMSVSEYAYLKTPKREGRSKFFHTNGKLKSTAIYSDNKLQGELTTYYSSGKLKRKDVYDEGKLITGNCFTEDGKDTTYFEYETVPKYPGGEEGLMKFIKSEVNYPRKAKRNGISGKVIIQFTVDKTGIVKDACAIKSVDPLLDAEALRVINLMEQWTPGTQDGVKVKVRFQLPINFYLY